MIEPSEYTLDEYQNHALATAVYPAKTALEYCLLQLASEAGEAAGKLAKALRKGAYVDREALAYELGDVLWYVANTANVIGYDLSMIAEMNTEKLKDRTVRGVIHGDGDNR
jgi:NTP pyrophosphatase (non-canonical NTP hydrolase)